MRRSDARRAGAAKQRYPYLMLATELELYGPFERDPATGEPVEDETATAAPGS